MTEKVCLVAAPVGIDHKTRRYNQIAKQVINSALAETGYSVLTIDKISKLGKITPDVIEHLLGDPLMIADLSGLEAVVYYMIAIRHAIQKPLIQLIQKDERIPLDLDPGSTLQLDGRDESSTPGRVKDLVAMIHSIELDHRHAYTPVSIAIQTMDSRLKPERRTDIPRFRGKLGECKLRAKMIMRLDPYTGAERPDLPLSDSVGYFPSTEISGLASGIYDLYSSAPGHPEALVSTNVTIHSIALRHPIKPHTTLCEKLHYDSLNLIRINPTSHATHHFKKKVTDCDCYCHQV